MKMVSYLILAALAGSLSAGTGRAASGAAAADRPVGVLRAAFVCVDGVYNSELMAPYDVLQHTVYRDPDNYIRCFIVTPDGKPFATAEGITVTPDYSFDDAPGVDILVIPSTETSMSDDLANKRLMDWIDRTASKASWVITVCDGAFPLAATGALDDRSATTFPADREELRRRFNKIDVRDDVRLVVDGKYITSVGGGMSYEPALYLVERLYGRESAARTAQGLVWPWNLSTLPYLENADDGE